MEFFIIILKDCYWMDLPEIQRISEDQIKKIYPDIYYKKYAKHVPIKKFQTESLQRSPSHPHPNPHTAPLIHSSNQLPQIPQIPPKIDYNARYDNYETIIQSNKYEVSRMAKFTKALSLKLELPVGRKENLIRSPVKEREGMGIDQGMLGRLKAIQDMEYQREIREREKRKKYLQEKALCKFVRRVKSNQISPRNSIELQPQLRTTNPQLQTMNSYESYQKPRHKLQSMFKQKNLTRQGSYKSQASSKQQKSSKTSKNLIKKTLQTIDSDNNQLQKKRDLIQQTKKIRKQVQSMQTFSYYDALILKKKRQQMLSLL